MSEPSDPRLAEPGPDRFPVAVVMRRQPSANRWISHGWTAVGVVVSDRDDIGGVRGERISEQPDGSEDYLWGGLTLRLFKDQAESYYHNLMAPHPSLYVVLRDDPRGWPEPFLVSASFDEANAYVEADADAQPVALPPELHQAIERFVLRHYMPEPRRKRKRRNWKEQP